MMTFVLFPVCLSLVRMALMTVISTKNKNNSLFLKSLFLRKCHCFSQVRYTGEIQWQFKILPIYSNHVTGSGIFKFRFPKNTEKVIKDNYSGNR